MKTSSGIIVSILVWISLLVQVLARRPDQVRAYAEPFPGWLIGLTGLTAWPGLDAPYVGMNVNFSGIPEGPTYSNCFHIFPSSMPNQDSAILERYAKSVEDAKMNDNSTANL